MWALVRTTHLTPHAGPSIKGPQKTRPHLHIERYISENFPLDIPISNHYIKGSSLIDPQHIVDVSEKCL